MGGMARCERTAAGDGLPEELGGVGPARGNQASAGNETLCVSASEAEGMSAAGCGGMQFWGIGRDRNPSSPQWDIGIVAVDAGCASLFAEWSAVRGAATVFDKKSALWMAWGIEL